MTQQFEAEKAANGKTFLRKHWTIVALFVAAGILAFIGAVYVFAWFVSDAQTIGLVPTTLACGQWATS